jgi:3D domain
MLWMRPALAVLGCSAALGALLPATAAARPLTRPTWLTRVAVTEYYPVPESHFIGRRVGTPGLSSRHRVDWLFSARGVTMEGDGIGLDGRRYHVARTGFGGWVDRLGRRSCIGCSRGVFWRAGGFWRNSRRQLTFPLDRGGWFNGYGVRYVPLFGARFGRGPSLPLAYYRSLAVDPDLIPLGSRVYIPYYRAVRGATGWFVAEDTGGAIDGRHVDVFRPPPPSLNEYGRSLRNQRIYVVPPRR